ncbi:MAG TPA: Asp-tRNA(Asn)/Glu-tRNA(Gln) amidotransferase subunit GatB [Longimicrobiales bacterium]|nr:Asp-tRNA(Asn)/Glu-tRNA(Gln) amidotransferase subunit GatB [Longimicrobiales bacterium]
MSAAAAPAAAVELEPVIGLEVHVQLKTRTKMFCADSAEFGAEPNSNVCPVCLGLPGALPVVNGAAIELAVRAALGLGCTIHERSVFARKNYFYPDLPKGYQISQFDRPLATDGVLEVPTDGGGIRPVRIRRIHVEEDAGKSLHDRIPGATAIDLNRAGVPLVEIVSEPDLRTAADARAYLARLKQILQYLGVSDCDMEKGSLRVDANVSVRPRGSATLGTKTEVKNMNSFANVERAIGFEIERQSGIVASGRPVLHETLLWDAGRGVARTMRSKEESHDYRYFEEPDLPPLVLGAGWIRAVEETLPELPQRRERRFREEYGLPEYDAGVLTAERDVADYFEATARAAVDAKAASNWIMTEVLSWANEHEKPVAEVPVTPVALGDLIRLIAEGTLSSTAAKKVFAGMVETGRSAREIVEAEGLAQVSDADRLERWIDEVLAANPDEARRYAEGEAKLVGFFMGQIMKQSGGKADPERVSQILKARLR